jgi:WhiB family redox-sensing transcriptional regulator
VPTRALEELVRGRAGCRGADTAAFYPLGAPPPGGDADAHARTERDRARHLCAGCPVTAACLELALRIPAGAHGIWGATTERDRRALLHRRRAAAARDELDLAGVG